MATRRQFFLTCSTVAAGASVLPHNALASFRISDVSLDEISFLAFSRQLRTEFLVHDESRETAALRLIEAAPLATNQDLSARAEDAANEKFSLLFAGASRQPLAQGTYVFEHGGLGRFKMFIVPVGRAGPQWSYYEAAFNRPAAGPADIQHGRWLR